MNKVVVADSAGYCFGVKRAVENAYKDYDVSNIYTYGSIIHNDSVINDLEKKGIKKIEDIKKFEKLTKGVVIIRAHGISKKDENYLKKLGHKIVDMTCPYVKKIHKLVEKYSSIGYRIIIIGNPDHPEIIGIKGWCINDPIIIREISDVDKIPFDVNEKYAVVSQTTFNTVKFADIIAKINEKCYNNIVLDTICKATEDRQVQTLQLAKNSDVMLVVGDKKSSNTRKLYDISSSECKETYFVQTASEMDFDKLKGKKLVGITAGASTPQHIIEEVRSKCQKILNKC